MIKSVLRAGTETPDKEKRLLLHTVKNEQFIQSASDILFYLLMRSRAYWVTLGGDIWPLVL